VPAQRVEESAVDSECRGIARTQFQRALEFSAGYVPVPGEPVRDEREGDGAVAVSIVECEDERD
jgi:hypothetical protein